ncbi:DUF7341 domain-containing protein, partial [Mycobacterium sp.]|uniref:DUF7341 domain-containing protein n=1 Tax=Mycobacterium sp. TaxID=1785 RepID=UPI003F950CFD
MPLYRQRLDDAVHSIADPIPTWHSGTCRWSPALYDSLRVELAGARTSSRAAQQRSRPPCQTSVLDLLIQIDAAVNSWSGGSDKGGTIERLHA